MSIPLVIPCGRGRGKQRDEKLERPDDYSDGCLGHLYKLAQLTYRGKPLAQEVLDRYTSIRETSTGNSVFNPIYLAGPERHYGEFCSENWQGSEVKLIDTDGQLHENLEAISNMMLRTHPHALSLLAAGDLLPDPEHLKGLTALLRMHEATADVVLPEIQAEALASEGVRKQSYSFFDDSGETIQYSFGQVYALRPSQVRWDIFSHAAKFHYGKRAKGFMAKTSALLWAPVLLAGALSRPRNARSLPYLLTNGIFRDIPNLKSGNITIPEAEDAIAKIALIHDARRKEVRRVVVAVNEWTSLAADVDTLAEAGSVGISAPDV
jgi:hypothetical protein